MASYEELKAQCMADDSEQPVLPEIQYEQMQYEQHKSNMKCYYKLFGGIAVLLVVFVVGGVWVGNNLTKSQDMSLGQWLSGKTWEEKKATSGYGPFDSVFYPESKKERPVVLPPSKPIKPIKFKQQRIFFPSR